MAKMSLVDQSGRRIDTINGPVYLVRKWSLLFYLVSSKPLVCPTARLCGYVVCLRNARALISETRERYNSKLDQHIYDSLRSSHHKGWPEAGGFERQGSLRLQQ